MMMRMMTMMTRIEKEGINNIKNDTMHGGMAYCTTIKRYNLIGKE